MSNSISNKNKKRMNKNKQRKEKKNDLYEVLDSTKISKRLQPSSPFPSVMIRKCPFFEPSQVVSGAATFLVRRWRLSDFYDPDPLLGGGTVSGFNELAKIYQIFRVERSTFRATITSNEPALPMTFGFIVRSSDPSTSIATLADAQNAIETSPTTGPMAVGTTQGKSVTNVRTIKVDHGAILGDPIALMSDMGFTGLYSGSSPSRNIWLAFIVLSPSASLLNNGVILDLYLHLSVRSFSSQNLME